MKARTDRLIRRARRSALVQRIVSPFARDIRPERWIFIVGCYNSGTTLLARVLAAHPAISALPIEGAFLTTELPPPERFGWTRMWCRCVDRVRPEPGSLSERTIRRIRKQWALWLPARPRNVLEKSVVNSARMPFLDDAFAPAYFISIVRNGYAAAEGMRRKARPAKWGNTDFPDGYPIELCAEQWRVSDEFITRDAGRVGRFHQIRYEDLVARPAAVLRELTDFLGLPALDATVLEGSWTLQGLDEPIRDMNAASLDRLSEDDRRAIERVAGATLARYGYTAHA